MVKDGWKLLSFYFYFLFKKVLKNQFLAKKGVKIKNFEKSKKVSLDISEIHVSKFGPIPMKIVAGSRNTHDDNNNNDGLFSTLARYYTKILLYLHRLPTYLGHNYHVLTSLLSPLTNVLLPSASRRKIEQIAQWWFQWNNLLEISVEKAPVPFFFFQH